MIILNKFIKKAIDNLLKNKTIKLLNVRKITPYVSVRFEIIVSWEQQIISLHQYFSTMSFNLTVVMILYHLIIA